jgi:ubiquinone/menaquinone biosynthesis C-methylase UbiE/pimeloyl-ACP methyl ester carboxylesterase
MSHAGTSRFLPTADLLTQQSLRRLHRDAIEDPAEVRRLLDRAASAGITLHNGVDRRSSPRIGHIAAVSADRFRLRAPRISPDAQAIYLGFEIGPTRYFFAAPPLGGGGDELLDLALPAAIYTAERRELLRVRVPLAGTPPVVTLLQDDRKFEGRLRDYSYQGMAVSVPDAHAAGLEDAVEVEYADANEVTVRKYGSIRHRAPDDQRRGWTQLGLAVTAVRPQKPFAVESRSHILEGGLARRAWRRVALAGAIAKRLPARASARMQSRGDDAPLEIVEYANDRGEPIRGLVDRACGGRGGTAVVVPPAWGRTKESFSALSKTLVATFERSEEPLSVLRFDGTNRRGESFIDPECRASGDEYLRFRFSRAVQDIRASLEFVRTDPSIVPERVVVVSFSLGSIEARRALVEEADAISGWVSVVGMVDLQSGLRTVSGGVDFAYGQSMGISFGRHELVGVLSDMDGTGADAFEHGLVFLEDAKRDMAALQLPITWIHGRHDAWMDLERVRDLLAAGPAEGRRLVEIPAGHQMRSGREALETFQLISTEVSRMALGRELPPVVPDLETLESRMRAERARCKNPELDRVGFWSDYLLGRDRRLGFELMSATSAYQSLMQRQIALLEVEAHDHVLDVGAGTGDFPLLLAEADAGDGAHVTQLDLIHDALTRGRQRLERLERPPPFSVERLVADLDVNGTMLPLATHSADRALASLVLSYVSDPQALLLELRRVLRPGATLVLSSLRRDADISKVYVDSMAELPPDRRRARFGSEAAEDFELLQHVFLNDAARLMQMEDEGRFRFWDGEDLSRMLAEAGFDVAAVETAFGEPAQAVVVQARRPV